MKITELCRDERPRERMLEHGASSLSNSELIAILLRTGTKNQNAIEVARNLLALTEGNLIKASKLSIDQMRSVEGIGPSKAVEIIAALELGKRMCFDTIEKDKKPIREALDVFLEMRQQLLGLTHEECWVLYLSKRNIVIAKEKSTIGSQGQTIIDIQGIARRALETRASAVILVHNHPSGDPTPGEADKKMTKNLRLALEAFEISLMDHVVICDRKFFSFADGGMQVV